MSLVAVREKIYTKLQGFIAGKLQSAYDCHQTGFEGYPAATFEPSDIINDFETNVENRRTYVFRIVLHQELQSVGRSEAVGILAALVDDVVQAFDEDWTLDGTVIQCKAIPSVWGLYDEGAGKVMYAELKLEAMTITEVI